MSGISLHIVNTITPIVKYVEQDSLTFVMVLEVILLESLLSWLPPGNLNFYLID